MLKKFLSFTIAIIMIFSCVSVVSASSVTVTDLEPNDDLETAQTVDANCTVTGSLFAPDFEAEEPLIDLDVFKFTLTERSKIVLTLTSSSGLLIPIIGDSDYENSYMPEFDEYMEEFPEEMVISAILEKGTYYIVLSDLFTEEENDYSFTMTCESAVETLKKENGVWKYYVGKNFTKATTLVKHEGIWFYVEDGIWNKTAETLVKYKDVWFYVKNGRWDRTANTLVKYKGVWFYVKNGRWTKASKYFTFKNVKFKIVNGVAQV